MPVHRHFHDKMGSVYASRAELVGVGARSESSSSAGEGGHCCRARFFAPRSAPAIGALLSPDGREVVLERVQERLDVVLLDLRRP